MPTYIVECYSHFSQKGKNTQYPLACPQWNIEYGWDRDDLYNRASPSRCSTESKSRCTDLHGLSVYVIADDPLEALAKALSKFNLHNKVDKTPLPKKPSRNIVAFQK